MEVVGTSESSVCFDVRLQGSVSQKDLILILAAVRTRNLN
jgi:hypothetical protein